MDNAQNQMPQGKIMIGHKLKKLRAEMNITQSDMASELGISASYLNLLENNMRPITVPLLFKLGQTYDLDLRDIAEDDSARLSARLTEISADPAMQEKRLSRREIQQLCSQHPQVAESLIHLFESFEMMRSAAYTGHQTSSGQTPAPSAIEQVRDYLERSGNYFLALEQAASDCRREAQLRPGFIFADLARWMEEKLGLSTRIMPLSVMGNLLRQHDPHRRRLLLSEVLKEPQRVFQLAVQIAQSYHSELLNRLVDEAGMETPESRQLLKIALAGYFAGALMMPYDAFFKATQDTRHDLDQLCRIFGASFEQVCHRLTTLNRQGMRGIPFFFIRLDEAGYVSKRLSGGGVELARHGGACARWIPHQVFRNPGQIRVQAAELEDGHRFFTIARTVVQPRTGPAHIGTPLFAVALGCDFRHVKDIGYADALTNSKSTPFTPIGMGCGVCERIDCQHRGRPPLGHELRFDPTRRQSGLFDLRG